MAIAGTDQLYDNGSVDPQEGRNSRPPSGIQWNLVEPMGIVVSNMPEPQGKIALPAAKGPTLTLLSSSRLLAVRQLTAPLPQGDRYNWSHRIIPALGQSPPSAENFLTLHFGISASIAPAMLDSITHQIAQAPDHARAKKLLFCACYGRWSKDAQGMSDQELLQCLQMLCDLHPSLLEFKHALYQVVIRLNHSSDYYAVANEICDFLAPYYPLTPVTPPPAENIPEPDTQPRSLHFKIQAPSPAQARLICEISQADRKQAQTTLPLPAHLLRSYAEWQQTYRRTQAAPQRVLVGPAAPADTEQINRCGAATTVLTNSFQTWQHSSEWQSIREQLQRWVPTTAPVTVVVSSDLLEMVKLPWNVCLQPLLAAYPQAEVVVQLAAQRPPQTVQVVGILAEDNGMDLEKSQAYITTLPDTQGQLLVAPTPEKALRALATAASVAMFSSQRSGYSGDRLWVNANDVVPMESIHQAISQGVARGLKLLLWNGGDGLEVAAQLATTGLPYLLVTREALPDRVVLELLKLVLRLMSQGQPLPAALRSARERLQEIERVFPAASWLPLVCHNGPLDRSLVWADLATYWPFNPIAASERVPRDLADVLEDTLPLESPAPEPTPIPDTLPLEAPAPEPAPIPVAAPAKSNPPPSIVIPPHVDYDTLSLDRCLTGYYSEVQSLAISADRKLIFSGHGDLGCKDNTVKVWLLESGELLQDLVGHRDGVRALATLSAPQCFWSGGADGQFLSWDLATGRVTPLATAIPGGINTLLPISGGQEAIGGTSGGRIYRWSQTGQTLTYWETGSAIQGLAVDSSEQLLAAAGADGMVSIWDLRRGKLLHQMRGHSGAVKAVTMTPNGDRVMTAGADHTIRVWDVASGLTLQVLVGHERAINCLALTPDGRSLISGSDDRSVKIWHWATGNLVNSLFGHSSPVVALALTNDGRMLVTGGYGEIRTWEIDS